MICEPDGFRIVEASVADAARFLEHWSAILAERHPGLFERDAAPTLEEAVERLQRRAAAPDSVVFLARRDAPAGAGERDQSRIIGMLEFRGHGGPQLSHSGIFGVTVQNGWRGQGAGSALVAALFAWAPSHGITRIELEVFSNNPDAVRWYERLGFEHEGRKRGAVQVGDRFEDILLMARRLG